MNTFILAETRKAGVDWATQSIPVDPVVEEYRTQTKVIYKNGDKLRIFSRLAQFDAFVASYGGTLRKADRIILVGAVDTNFIDGVVKVYRSKGHTIEVNQTNGQVLSVTELKRKVLLQQMEDLEKEERLHAVFKNLEIPGVKFNRVNISVTNTNRTFNVTIDGKFE